MIPGLMIYIVHVEVASHINMKTYKYDPNKSWEENYKELEKHHKEETEYLYNQIDELSADIKEWEECCMCIPDLYDYPQD